MYGLVFHAASVSTKQTIASVLKGQFEEIYEEAKDELSKETGQDYEDSSVCKGRGSDFE